MTLRRPHPLLWLAPAAVAVRVMLFLGRGDYVAYDEAWYLLLGRNLFHGDGYTLSGLQHVALSPLFPILAGALDWTFGNPIWAGRIVAAVVSGLLVIPCWSIFRRLSGRRTTLLACGLIAVMPSLAPFVVAWWVGWDLWVGAEPVLHLFLYAGVALFLRARARGRLSDWTLAGAAFGLAYLARSEGIIPFALLMLFAGVTAVVRRQPRRALQAGLLGLAFVAVAAPYWVYLHDALGRWTLTGRGVDVAWSTSAAIEPRTPRVRGEPARRRGSATTIERMLWLDEKAPYMAQLYALDASGTRLASTYWGVAPRDRRASGGARRDESAPPSEVPAQVSGAEELTTVAESSAVHRAPPDTEPAAMPLPSVVGLYARTMLRIVVPWFLWPFVLVGFLMPGRGRFGREAPVTGALLATSLLIAVVVAVDPRTQLFLVPLLAFYGARGIRVVGALVDRRVRRAGLRRRFVEMILATVALLLLLGTDARRLYLSLAVGSPHHIIAAQRRAVGEVLRRMVPEGERVMSWAPTTAVHARRDWQVLPAATFPDLLRYAAAVNVRYIVLSAYTPSPIPLEDLPREFLILRPTPEATTAKALRIDVTETGEHYAVGWLKPGT